MSAPISARETQFVQTWNTYRQEMVVINAEKERIQVEEQRIQAEKARIQAEKERIQGKKQHLGNEIEQICTMIKDSIDTYVSDLDRMKKDLESFSITPGKRTELTAKIQKVKEDIIRVKSLVKTELPLEKLKAILIVCEKKIESLSSEIDKASALRA